MNLDPYLREVAAAARDLDVDRAEAAIAALLRALDTQGESAGAHDLTACRDALVAQRLELTNRRAELLDRLRIVGRGRQANAAYG